MNESINPFEDNLATLDGIVSALALAGGLITSVADASTNPDVTPTAIADGLCSALEGWASCLADDGLSAQA
jgi:hypothetical protein